MVGEKGGGRDEVIVDLGSNEWQILEADAEDVAPGEMSPGEEAAGATAENKDRYGNEISFESIENWINLAEGDSEKFKAEFLKLSEEEADAIENGIDGEFSRMAMAVASERGERSDVDERMSELEQTRKLVMELIEAVKQERQALVYGMMNDETDGTSGEDKSGEGDSEDKEGEAEGSENGEESLPEGRIFEVLDPMSPTYNIDAQKRRADIVSSVRHFSEDFRDAVLEQLAKVEAEEREIKEKAMNEFAASDDSEGSDDDVAAAAAAAGESSFRETTDKDEAERSKKYREGMSRAASEAKPGRFDKFEEQTQRTQETSGQEDTAAKNYEWIDKDYYNKLKSWAEDEAKSPIKNRFGDPEIVDKKARPRRLEKIRNKNEYIADDEYYNKMQGWANDEQGSPVENRFGDSSESAKSEREKRAGGLWSRLKGRIWRSGSKGENNDGNNTVYEEAEDTESLANEPKIKPDYTGLGGVLDELLKNSEQGDSSADDIDNELNFKDSEIEALRKRLADIKKLNTDVLSDKDKQLAEARREYDAELRGLLNGKSLEEFLQELQQMIDKLDDAFYEERTKEVELFNSLPVDERTDERWELGSTRSREIEDKIRNKRWLLEEMKNLEIRSRAGGDAEDEYE